MGEAERRIPQEWDVWRNRKNGNLYVVTSIAKHHRTGETWVGYRNVESGDFIRELDGVEDCWYNRFDFVRSAL